MLVLPQIAMLEDEEKEGSKDVEEVESLRFGSAGTKKGIWKRDESGEGRELGKGLDILVFLFYNHDQVYPLVDLL